jgi:hypothetical protein
MLRGILNRALGGSRRRGTRRPAAGGGRPAAGGSNADLERGARSLFRGLSRRRRGL